MQGLAFEALINNSRTFCSLLPIYLLKSSGPFTLIKLNLLSLARADAMRVFPHPDGPYNKTLIENLIISVKDFKSY